jgi:hypothetical protein
MPRSDANEDRGANQGFKWIAKDDFHERAGELRYEKVRGGVYVEGDTDGDGISDLTVFLKGVSTMKKDDFFL